MISRKKKREKTIEKKEIRMKEKIETRIKINRKEIARKEKNTQKMNKNQKNHQGEIIMTKKIEIRTRIGIQIGTEMMIKVMIGLKEKKMMVQLVE